ncbi:MAG: sulfotransferase [Terricaulis sp.]
MLNDPEALRLLDGAKRAYAGGDKAGAEALARQVLARVPGEATALQILGVVALDGGAFAEARRQLEASNAARPNAVTFNMIGVAAGRMGDASGARAAFSRAGELGLVEGWRNLGISEKGEAQIAAFTRALALSADDAVSHAGLAQAYEGRHDLSRAREHGEAALCLDANNGVARLTLARVLMREKDFAGAEAMATLLAQSPRANAELRVQALGLIGDARDRRDDAHGAFEAFTAANQLSLSTQGAWLNATERLYHPESVRKIADAVAGLDVSNWSAPDGVRDPVFLIGFPRSGTTLLDQILSSHSGIVCLEESEHFGDALSDVITERGRALAPGSLSEDDLARVRESYWRRVDAPTGAIVVDKFPLNIVVLPLIKRVFPNAKIIFALRDPRDVVLSCFQQRFTINAAMAQFLELQWAGAYYDQVMGLFELCRARLGLDLHQVRYEDVVADLEGGARGLCAFLGVGFEPAMLDYRSTALKRDIATPSARQVIEPLYKRSVERWRRYEEELRPVLPMLAPWAERYGYAP